MMDHGEFPDYPGSGMFPEEIVYAIRREPGFADRMRVHRKIHEMAAARTEALTTVATAAATENEEI